MKRSILACAAGLALLFASATLAPAADRAETVKFAAGKSSAVRKDKIKGDQGITYRLDAKAGQVMQVLFSPSNRSCYFNVFAPGEDTARFIGSTSGNEFGLNLDKSGTYSFQVYLMRNAARRGESCKVTISFEITGGSAAKPSAAGEDLSGVPAKDSKACLAAVAKTTNNSKVEILDRTSSEANNTVIVGVGPDRAKWRCLVKNGRVADVMSLTDEGAM